MHTLERNLQEKVRGTMDYHRQFREKLAEKQKRIDVIMEIIDILVKAGATLSPDILVAFWGTGAQIGTFLELYPQLVQLSFVHRDEILKELKRSLEITEADMDDERQEFHRGWGYGYVPQYLKDQREMEEYSLETFKTFLRSYDPDTGMYNLFNEGTGWNNNYQNQYYEDE